jgi:hypothetical protein
MSFEIVDMNLEELSKYRRMLAGNLSHARDSNGAESELSSVAANSAGVR